MRPKTLCFDLDGTICTNTWGAYDTAEPFPWAVARVNALADAGHKIIVFTARGTATGIDWTEVTRGQLDRWGVKYDELKLGKPSADVYVDDRAVHTDAWRISDVASAPGFFPEAPVGEGQEDLPLIAPAQLATLTEVGRTVNGTPLWVERHAERLARRAQAAGFTFVPETAEAVRVVESAAQAAGGRGDVVFVMSLVEPGGWDQLHTAVGAAPAAGLHVAARPLEETVWTLLPLLADAEAFAVRAATSPRDGAWPLTADLRDALGGDLAGVRDGTLVLASAGPEPSVGRRAAVEAAQAAGIPVTEGTLTRDLDEYVLIGLPFGALAVGELDGTALTPSPGPVTERLQNALVESTGIDLRAQLSELSTTSPL